MMTYEQVLAMAKELQDDVIIFEGKDRISIYVDDFDGFDEDWCEVMRELDDVDAVEEFLYKLKAEALEVEYDLYTFLHFDGFTVIIGYTSFDI